MLRRKKELVLLHYESEVSTMSRTVMEEYAVKYKLFGAPTMDLSFDTNLISSKEAATLTGYVADYITRQCRAGKIRSKQVGRMWLIDKSSLRAHFAQEELRKQENAKELARTRELEYAAAKQLRESTESAKTPIKSPYAPLPSLPEWFVEETSRAPVRGSFAALAATLAIMSAGLYAGLDESRAAALAFVHETGSVSIALAQTAVDVFPKPETGEARISMRTHTVLPRIMPETLELPEFPVLASVRIIDMPRPMIPERHSHALNEVSETLVSLTNAVALFGRTLQEISASILALHAQGIDAWVHATPEVPPKIIAGVERLGYALASYSNEAPRIARASASSFGSTAENFALGIVGHTALAYDMAKETTARAYEYAPSAKLAAVRTYRSSEMTDAGERPSGLMSEPIPANEKSSDNSQSNVLQSLEHIALRTYRAMRNLFNIALPWFAGTATNVADFLANRVHATELCLRDDQGETCLTRSQLQELFPGLDASGGQDAYNEEPRLQSGPLKLLPTSERAEGRGVFFEKERSGSEETAGENGWEGEETGSGRLYA